MSRHVLPRRGQTTEGVEDVEEGRVMSVEEGRVMGDEMLEVMITVRDGVPVVSAEGEVDVSTAPRLREQLAALPIDAGRVVVDLAEVSFLDSTGLGVLVASWKKCQEAGARLDLVVTTPQVSKVLEITRLDSMFRIFESLDDAFADDH